MANTNVVVHPAAKASLETFKNEIAAELGIQTGPDTPSRLNGKVGGEMVKRLIAFAEAELNK